MKEDERKKLNWELSDPKPPVIQSGRMLSAPTTAAATPPTGRLIVDPYSGRVRLSERSIFPPVSEQSRHRAG